MASPASSANEIRNGRNVAVTAPITITVYTTALKKKIRQPVSADRRLRRMVSSLLSNRPASVPRLFRSDRTARVCGVMVVSPGQQIPTVYSPLRRLWRRSRVEPKVPPVRAATG